MLTRTIGTLAVLAVFFPVYALNFVVYGDTRTNTTPFTRVLNRLARENPAVILHSGDIADNDTYIPNYTAVVGNNAVTNALWQNNLFLVARGNHESWTALRSISPTMVRNNDSIFSFTMDNCFCLSMGMAPFTANSFSRMASLLSSAEARAAHWRIVFHHVPIYCSCAEHPADGIRSDTAYPGYVYNNISNFRQICDTTRVTVDFSGHSHIYERSYLMFNNTVTNTSNDIPASAQGTVYVVSGGGGAPLYNARSPRSWRSYAITRYHYCLLQSNPDSLVCTAKDTTGAVLDRFVIRRNATAVKPHASDRTEKNVPGISRLGKNIFTVNAPAGASCALHDISGKVVMLKKTSAAGERIDLSSMKQGLYIAKITASGQIKVQKIVTW
ncbi:MAG: T9SS type A sorting domain-containing protein [Chitinispirillaceae bacterium]|nr:T9SS type A sorting domain-containing protein [Chitinispirillaceae bacterium]